jgi:CBS domain containing-hemolysin-like protein
MPHMGLTAVASVLLPMLVAMSALCSGTETALFSLTHADRLRLRRSHPTVHATVQKLLAEPRGLLVAILLLNVTVNTAYFTVAGMVGKRLFEDSAAVAAGFSIGCVLVLILFGEVLPKAFSAVHRLPVSRVMAVPVLAWFRLITPVRLVLDGVVVAPLARLFRPAGQGEAERLTADDLQRLLEVGQSQGVLRESEHQLLADVVELGTLRVRDVMTPRVDVVWLKATDTSQELLALARDTGFTRFPVCRGAFNERQIVGIVNVQRVLPELNKSGASARLALAGLVDAPRFVPDKARVDQLLEHFRSTATDAAVVVSEHGELTGMVQIDDVIAELVKFASASHESGEGGVRMVDDGEWEVPGRLSVRDWEEFFEPVGARGGARVSTVAGLILARLGRVPRAGDKVTVGNVAMRVEAVQGRNIQRVRVRVLDAGGAK